VGVAGAPLLFRRAPAGSYPVRVHPDVLVSDAEREQCARRLREACGEGRLEVRELEQRLDRAYRARTRRELRVLVSDLPRGTGRKVAAVADRIDRAVLKAHAFTFTATNGSLVGLWAATGAGEFWPAWLLAPWGVLLAWHAGGSWSLRRMLRGGRHPRRSRRLA
jgi:hypothetical protein